VMASCQIVSKPFLKTTVSENAPQITFRIGLELQLQCKWWTVMKPSWHAWCTVLLVQCLNASATRDGGLHGLAAHSCLQALLAGKLATVLLSRTPDAAQCVSQHADVYDHMWMLLWLPYVPNADCATSRTYLQHSCW
jgi:hypothetical protein